MIKAVRTRIIIPVLDGKISSGLILNFLTTISSPAVISIYHCTVIKRDAAKARVEHVKIKRG
jgi:hypothetical protein